MAEGGAVSRPGSSKVVVGEVQAATQAAGSKKMVSKGCLQVMNSSGKPVNSIWFQFNPTDFTDAYTLRFERMSSPGLAEPDYQYVGGEGHEIQLELFIDGTTDENFVKNFILKLEQFIPTSIDDGVPPLGLFAFGGFQKKCIINGMRINYTVFDSRLNPRRATISIPLLF